MKKPAAPPAGSSPLSGKRSTSGPSAISDHPESDQDLYAEPAGETPTDASLEQLGRVPINDTDNLNETVLGSAAVGDPDTVPPEVVKGTEALTEWDEPADAAGTWTPREGLDDGMLDAARLYEAGIEEADRERRLAAQLTDEV
jgi:hypothetical protein